MDLPGKVRIKERTLGLLNQMENQHQALEALTRENLTANRNQLERTITKMAEDRIKDLTKGGIQGDESFHTSDPDIPLVNNVLLKEKTRLQKESPNSLNLRKQA